MPDYPLQFADFNMVAFDRRVRLRLMQVYFVLFMSSSRCMRGRRRRRSDPDGTGAEGLEWEVLSPAPFHTFETPPKLDAPATSGHRLRQIVHVHANEQQRQNLKRGP